MTKLSKQKVEVFFFFVLFLSMQKYSSSILLMKRIKRKWKGNSKIISKCLISTCMCTCGCVCTHTWQQQFPHWACFIYILCVCLPREKALNSHDSKPPWPSFFMTFPYWEFRRRLIAGFALKLHVISDCSNRYL